MEFITYIILAFVLSLVITGLVLPIILNISVKKKLFDVPNNRSVHKRIIPRLGGLAFVPIILMIISFIVGLDSLSSSFLLKDSINKYACLAPLGYCALILLYFIGVVDDLIGVRYVHKFIAQIIASLLIVLSGIYINNFYGLFGLYEIPYYVGAPLSIFLMVYLINAVNLIDGIDGLCSGLSIVALVFFVIIYMENNDWLFVLLSVATLGVLIPFFYVNVFGTFYKQQKLFMGDTGSLTIGLILSLLAIHLSMVGTERTLHLNIVQVFSLVFIPFLDVLRVMFVRASNGKGLFKADMNHIHHKMLRLGYSPRRSLMHILFWQLFFITMNMLLSNIININILLLLDIIIWILFNQLISKRIKQKEKVLKE